MWECDYKFTNYNSTEQGFVEKYLARGVLS